MADMEGLSFEIIASTSEAVKNISNLTNSLSALKKSLNTGFSTNTISKLSSLGRETNTTAKSIGTLGKNTSKAAQGMKDFVSSIATAPFKHVATQVKSFATGFSKLGNAIKRVMFYRAIRTLIKEVGDAFKEGTKNLYDWSSAVGGRFASSMDSMATSFAYFKNSIGAAVAPLLNALAPAIDIVVDKVVTLLNVINQLFARLTGATYWTKAVKQAQAYGDAASGAGSAAKEAMKYLAPFDELNVLPDNNSGGGGGGGVSAGSGLFEEMTAFNEEIANFADLIKAAWDKNDWKEVGQYIGGKLNELMASIPWKEAGEAFGKGVNAIIGTEYWTLKTVKFDELGANIATFLNNAIGKIDFNIAGQLLTRKITALFDFVIGFIEEFDFGQLTAAISDFFIGAFDEASEWLDSKDWVQIGQTIYRKLDEAIKGIKWTELAESFSRFLGSLAGAAAGFAIGITVEFARGTWEDIKAEWNRRVAELGIIKATLSVALDLAEGPLTVRNWIDEHLVKPFSRGLLGAFNIDPNSALGSLVTTLTTIAIRVETLMSPILAPFQTLASLIEAIKSGIDWIKNTLGEGNGTALADTVRSSISSRQTNSSRSSQSTASSRRQSATTSASRAAYSASKGIKIPVTAQYVGAKDEIPAVQKRVATSSIFEQSEDKMSTASKTIHNAVASFTSKIDAIRDNNFLNKNATFSTKTDAIKDNNFTGKNATFSTKTDAIKDNKFTGKNATFSTKTDAIKDNNFTGKNATFTTKTDSIRDKSMSGFAAGLTSWYRNWSSGYNSMNLSATLTGWQRSSSWYAQGWDKISMTAYITDAVTSDYAKSKIKAAASTRAEGGVFSGGRWTPIQSFARGGSPYGGQIFRARENGNPELVGTLRGSTAVMNNDQIVASVSAGVARAISSIQFHLTGLGSVANSSGYEQGGPEEMMYRAFYRALADSDFAFEDDINIDVDGDNLFRGVVRRNKINTIMTGINALA